LIDLSKATKLKDVVFCCGMRPRWVTTTLRTITPDHRNLQQISLETPFTLFHSGHGPVDLVTFRHGPVDSATFRHRVGDAVGTEWPDLDHLLAQLWESHSIRPKVFYTVPSWLDKEVAGRCVESLLSEISKKGIVDLVPQQSWHLPREPEG
jgi:hypothetical protein